MKRLLLAAMMVLCLTACGNKVPPVARLASTDVVLAFGDSLTYGIGAKAEDSYPVVLGQLIGRTVVRSGVPGEQTAGGLARLPEVLDEHKPKLVIVCLGGNDMLRKGTPETIEADLRKILTLIKSRGLDAMLIGVPTPTLITRPPDFYFRLAKEFAIPYEGDIITSVLYKSDLKSDPIHPNATGYRKVAEAVARLMRDAGAI